MTLSYTPKLSCLSAEDLDAQLGQALSLGKVVSASHRRQPPKVDQPFRKIGAGACGAIFGQHGKSIVIKVAKVSDNNDLWNDYLMHKLISEQLIKHGVTSVKVPRCYSFIPKDQKEF
ncbi:hypothetical protein ACHAPT_003332 [Fusarium lateritium]